MANGQTLRATDVPVEVRLRSRAGQYLRNPASSLKSCNSSMICHPSKAISNAPKSFHSTCLPSMMTQGRRLFDSIPLDTASYRRASDLLAASVFVQVSH